MESSSLNGCLQFSNPGCKEMITSRSVQSEYDRLKVEGKGRRWEGGEGKSGGRGRGKREWDTGERSNSFFGTHSISSTADKNFSTLYFSLSAHGGTNRACSLPFYTVF